MRAREARRLLKDAPMRPVAEIALASGFDSSATFYRVFRNIYGITPGDARVAAFND
jgi:transcriptional regulator GlxA family with amidase domain